jgi:60 kDa SS-A/Ro ribonucleoprotein
MTGTFQGTYYATAKFQLDKVLELLNGADPVYVAKLAIYARKYGLMKDMPSFLVAWLGANGHFEFLKAFDEVIDNGRMLRNFVQYIRSGVFGRTSFGSRMKRQLQRWLINRPMRTLIRAVPGTQPSLADIVKMAHPRPRDREREAFFGWLIGSEINQLQLPRPILEFESFKAGNFILEPDVPFQLLTGLDIDAEAWKGIARNAPWMMTRMNLNTFLRHDVFEDAELVQLIADRLRDPELIRRARQFPYQIMTAYINTHQDMPFEIKEALQDAMEVAMEVAIENVPTYEGQIYVLLDTSGSMGQSITGYGPRASKVRCVDVAALFAAAILRKNPKTKIIPFDTRVHRCSLNHRDTVLTIAKSLSRFCGGGTNCSAPLRQLNNNNAKGDTVIYISDNESWADRYYHQGTGVQNEWKAFQRRNPNARMILLDIVASDNTQAKDRPNVLNVGGFSDHVFTIIDKFMRGHLGGDHFVKEVKETISL